MGVLSQVYCCVCSPCTFFHLGVAHILLLGLLVDFWAQWLPAASAKRTTGPAAQYVLPAHVRKAISERASDIMLTELFGKPYTDITKCASCTG